MNIEEHVIYKLRNAQVSPYPYPHFFADNVFPDEFYNRIIDGLADDELYTQMGGNYPDRFFGPNEIPEGCEFMGTERFMREVLMIFSKWVRKAFPEGDINIASDLRFIRDKFGYQIGPHTDAPWKLVSLLFYLPEGYRWLRHGTSIYVPNNPKFRCAGGPHYGFEDFKKVYTAPYVRNSCFGFWKTNNAFHGVEKLDEHFQRDVLLYNVYDEKKIPNKDVPEV